MIPSVTSNSLQRKDGMARVVRFPNFSSELGNLSRVDSPVETHLSVESNLVSPADQPEPLAALVVGRPVVRTGVSLVGSRSICLAELTLRDVLAAVSFAPISD